MENCDLSFCELRCKEVVNVVDGRRLGRIIDIIFDSVNRRVKGLIVPECRRFFIFRAPQDIFVPWRCVRNIGEDVILVELVPDGRGNLSCRPPVPPDACILEENGGGSGSSGSGGGAGAEENGESRADYAEYKDGGEYRGKKNKGKSYGYKDYGYKNYGYKGDYGGGKDNYGKNNYGGENGKVNAEGLIPPNCDKRCEKCMLFDCAFRWKHDGRNFHFKMC